MRDIRVIPLIGSLADDFVVMRVILPKLCGVIYLYTVYVFFSNTKGVNREVERRAPITKACKLNLEK